MEKNKVMMISIIVLLVALLGTIVGLGIFTINSLKKGEEPQTQGEQVSEIKPLSKDELTLVELKEPITTNLPVGEDGKDSHVIRLNMSLAINNTVKKDKESEKTLASVSSKEVIVRDVVLDILKKKTYEQMKKPDAREILKEEILQSLQDEFATNLIVAVYVDPYYQ